MTNFGFPTEDDLPLEHIRALGSNKDPNPSFPQPPRAPRSKKKRNKCILFFFL